MRQNAVGTAGGGKEGPRMSGDNPQRLSLPWGELQVLREDVDGEPGPLRDAAPLNQVP